MLDHSHSYLGCICSHSAEVRRHLEQHLQLEKFRMSRSDWVGNIRHCVHPVRQHEHCYELRGSQKDALEKDALEKDAMEKDALEKDELEKKAL